MIQLIFTQEDVDNLNYERFYHPDLAKELKIKLLYLPSYTVAR